MEIKGFFQFEIIINVLVSFFRFIWIPMLYVYGHYKYYYSYIAGNDFRRQNLTPTRQTWQTVWHLYNVKDVGPTLYKCYTNVLRLLVYTREIMTSEVDPALYGLITNVIVFNAFYLLNTITATIGNEMYV